MSIISEHIEAITNAKRYHIEEDYTYIRDSSGKLMSFEFVILKRGEHSVNLHRYLLEVEEKGKIKKYFYNIDHGIPDMIGKNIYFESRYLDNAPINEMLHVSRVW